MLLHFRTLLLIVTFSLLPRFAVAAETKRFSLALSGTLDFSVAAQGTASYEQLSSQYLTSDFTVFWPWSFLGLGSYVHYNWLIRQEDLAYGLHLTARWRLFFLRVGYGLLKSTFHNFSIDTRSGTHLDLETGLRIPIHKAFYLQGSLRYFSKSYRYENGDAMFINLYEDVAMPYLGMALVF